MIPKKIAVLVGKEFDFPVNCFSVSEFYFRDSPLQKLSADEMLNFVAENFRQVSKGGPRTLALIWSRSSFEIPVGGIEVQKLSNRSEGFPFGLVLEHSFVQIDDENVIQKADPSLISKIEIIPAVKAMGPYVNLQGFEVTWHTPILFES